MTLACTPTISDRTLRELFQKLCGHPYPSEFELNRALERVFELRDEEIDRLRDQVEELESDNGEMSRRENKLEEELRALREKLKKLEGTT